MRRLSFLELDDRRAPGLKITGVAVQVTLIWLSEPTTGGDESGIQRLKRRTCPGMCGSMIYVIPV